MEGQSNEIEVEEDRDNFINNKKWTNVKLNTASKKVEKTGYN